ncbi:fibronectin type III domain-containing protein [Patescibacteria group bacterium]|nr:fibronectin type III domain-containing protein [Patescibacteria group bacterium]MBU1931802.1 fibronectin type III domain-containing protein [Patescibacteria group bacterium]
MVKNPPPLSLKFTTLLLLLAGLGLSIGLSMERQLYQKQAEEVPAPPVGCQEVQPATPANLRGWSGPNEGQVSLVWDQVEGITGYKINYSPVSVILTGEVIGLYQKQSHTLTDLEPGEDYYFTITAINDCSFSSASPILKVAAYTSGVEQNIIYLPAPIEEEAIVSAEEATPAAEVAASAPLEAEVTPLLLVEPEKKPIRLVDLFQGTLPWIMGAVIVWGIVVLVKLRMKTLARETESLEQGTEIPISEAETMKSEPVETEEVQPSAPPQPQGDPRPPVEPPAPTAGEPEPEEI